MISFSLTLLFASLPICCYFGSLFFCVGVGGGGVFRVLFLSTSSCYFLLARLAEGKKTKIKNVVVVMFGRDDFQVASYYV